MVQRSRPERLNAAELRDLGAGDPGGELHVAGGQAAGPQRAGVILAQRGEPRGAIEGPGEWSALTSLGRYDSEEHGDPDPYK